MEQLAERTIDWIMHSDSLLNSLLRQISSTNAPSDPFILQIDAMELLQQDVHLGSALLKNPEKLSAIVMEAFEWLGRHGSAGVKRGSRLWFRLACVPLPMVSVDNLKKQTSAGGEIVQVLGVVYATSNLQHTAFLRCFKCKTCGCKLDLYPEDEAKFPPCCSQPAFDEDLKSGIYVPYQELLLGEVPKLSFTSTIRKNPILVTLHDDLTGQVQIGDSISVIGHLSFITAASNSITQSAHSHMFCHLQIKANNIKTINLNSMRLPIAPILEKHFKTRNGIVSLNLLADQGNIYSQLTDISFLLSLVTSISSKHYASEVKFGNDPKTERKSIHVLYQTSDYSSRSLARVLGMSLLATRSIQHSSGCKNVLAKVFSSTGQKIYAGSLALANDGICIIDISRDSLNKEEMHMLCDCMEKPLAHVKKGADFAFSCNPTIWGLHLTRQDESLFIQDHGSSQSKEGLLYRSLLSKFDIITPSLDFMLSEEPESRNLIFKLNGSVPEHDRLDKIKEHIAIAMMGSDEVCRMSKGAEDLVRKYYLHLRKIKLDQHDDTVCLQSLESLLRVASACARLCMRREVEEVPDAALAILLCEHTFLAKYGFSNLERMVDRLNLKCRNSYGCSSDGGGLDELLLTLHAELKHELSMPFQPEE